MKSTIQQLIYVLGNKKQALIDADVVKCLYLEYKELQNENEELKFNFDKIIEYLQKAQYKNSIDRLDEVCTKDTKKFLDRKGLDYLLEKLIEKANELKGDKDGK